MWLRDNETGVIILVRQIANMHTCIHASLELQTHARRDKIMLRFERMRVIVTN